MFLYEKNKTKIHTITKIAVLTAIASVLMLFEFPLWFAPGFYKIDLSDTVILMGGFAMGPLAAALMQLFKNLINLLLNGTETAFVGELANFITGCTLVVPAAMIYKFRKNKSGAVIGLSVGSVSLAAVGGLLNYFFLIPAFSQLYGTPVDAIVAMGSALNPLVSDLTTLVLFTVVPFNLAKGILCSGISLLLYKHLSRILHM